MPEESGAVSPDVARKVPAYRRRPHLTMTVHPETVTRLNWLSTHFREPQGRIVDKLVVGLSRCFDEEGKPVKLTCINGETCRWDRRDVPEVL